MEGHCGQYIPSTSPLAYWKTPEESVSPDLDPLITWGQGYTCVFPETAAASFGIAGRGVKQWHRGRASDTRLPTSDTGSMGPTQRCIRCSGFIKEQAIPDVPFISQASPARQTAQKLEQASQTPFLVLLDTLFKVSERDLFYTFLTCSWLQLQIGKYEVFVLFVCMCPCVVYVWHCQDKLIEEFKEIN